MVAMWALIGCLPTALCSPFIDPANSIVIQVLTWTIFLWQFSAVVFIVFVYFSMIEEIQTTQQDVSDSMVKRTSNASLFLQIFTVTGSNILCWIPSGIVFLVSLFKEKYQTNILIKTTVTLTTVNSIINPVVFLATTVRKMCRSP